MRVVFLNGPARGPAALGGWRGLLGVTLGIAAAAVLAVLAFTAFLVILPFAVAGAWWIRRRVRKTLAEMQERERAARAEAFARGEAPPQPRGTIIDAEYRVVERE